MRVQPGVVSTIVTVFNRPRLVREAIESVLAQTYLSLEIVVVDDGSTDETGAVCGALARTHPRVIRYLRQTNKGAAAAANAGLLVISGEFVQFLDSDDLLAPEKFARQVAGLQAHPDCGLSYCQTQEYVLGEPPTDVPSRRTGQQFRQLFPALLSGRLWPSPSPLYRRSVIDANGLFVDSSIYQDWEYECRVASRNIRLHYEPQILAHVRRTHHLEGRQKGAVAGAKVAEYARVLEKIAVHADHPDITDRDRDRFSRRLFDVARRCGAGGFEREAERLLALARSNAAADRRRRMTLYAGLARIAGWRDADAAASGIENASARWQRWRRQPEAAIALWAHRIREAVRTVSGQPVVRWPALLRQRWIQRRSAVRA